MCTSFDTNHNSTSSKISALHKEYKKLNNIVSTLKEASNRLDYHSTSNDWLDRGDEYSYSVFDSMVESIDEGINSYIDSLVEHQEDMLNDMKSLVLEYIEDAFEHCSDEDAEDFYISIFNYINKEM